MDQAAHSKSMLMGYFEANEKYPSARDHLYVNFPKVFTWHPREKVWKPHKGSKTIGCMHFASPKSGECFYLHTLLTVVKRARSFQELRSFEETEYPTFKSSCLA
jgi:hypothetical protein